MTTNKVAAAASSAPAPSVTAGAAALRRVLSQLELPTGRLIRAILLGACGVGSAVALMGTSAWLIARASQMPPVLDLTMAVVSVRAFGIGRAVFRYLERLASHSVALAGLVTLRTRLYARLAAADPRLALGLRRGDLLARIGADVDQIGDVVIKGLLPFGVAGVVTLAASIASLVILPSAGAALVAAVLLAGLGSPWLAAAAAARSHADSVDARAGISARTLAHLDSLDELRVGAALARSRRRIAAAEDTRATAVDRAATPAAVAAALQHVAVGVGVLGGLVFGAQAVADGRLAAVWLAVLALLPLAAVEACAGLPAAAAELVAGSRAATRLVPLLEAPAADRSSVPPALPSADQDASLRSAELSASALRVGWSAPLAGLPTQVRVRPGQVLAILGPTGAGKTTLALTLAGLIPPLSGSVRLGDVDLDAIADLPRRVSFTAHDAHIFGTTLRENLLVAATEGTDDQALAAAAQRAGLADWLAGLPEGLDTPLAAGGHDLSGGERRRVLLTRALLTDAQFLILDEPTEHLDDEATVGVFAELTALAHGPGGPAVIVLTHDERLSADEVLRIDPR